MRTVSLLKAARKRLFLAVATMAVCAVSATVFLSVGEATAAPNQCDGTDRYVAAKGRPAPKGISTKCGFRSISDALVANVNTATLTAGAGRLARAVDFDQVRALTTIVTGGAEDDTADRNAINYVLELAGSWREI